MTYFYILSLKHRDGDLLAWWRPDGKGYTSSLDEAGVYSPEAILARKLDPQENIAIATDIARREQRAVVLNDSAIVKRLKAARMK